VRYHFHVDDHLPNNDRDGTELETLDDVEHEACRLAGNMLVDGAMTFWGNPNWRVRVTDETGAPVLTIMLMGVRGAVSDGSP
jgi:hypothetical protein